MIRTNQGHAPTDVEWAGLIARQSLGQFYAVITTGIVCRDGCPARMPLRKNIRVFQSFEDAELAGFRACKRCKPMAARPESSQ